MQLNWLMHFTSGSPRMLEVQKVQVFSRVIEDIQDRGFMYLIPEQNVLLLCPHQNLRLVGNEKNGCAGSYFRIFWLAKLHSARGALAVGFKTPKF